MQPVTPLKILSLWAINGQLDEQRLCSQLDAMRRDGLDGVVFHPRFYPGNPPYLSSEYLRIVSRTILHARDLGLAFWIYDENGWPSGVAGGELIRQFPDDAAGLLTLHEGESSDAWHNFSAKGKSWHLRLVRTREIDYLNPAACGHFLSLVHDRYRDGLDPAAWAHVEAFFADEPEYGLGVNVDKIPPHGGISWSPVLPDLYRQRFGRDVRDDLPLVFFNAPDGSHEEVRIRFWEFMTDQLCEGFFAPYHAWCKREGKLFTGHLKGDEHPLFQVMMNGSCHQAFRHFDLPGIDPLERFPSCDYYARETASVAHQFGSGRAMAEAMGGAGWGSSPEDFERFLLWLTNHGATDLVIHLHQYRLDSHAIRDWPPSNPNGLNWREAYPEVLRRVRAKTNATAVAKADTLVVAPYRGIMAGYEPWSVLASNIHNCATYPDTPAGRLNTTFLNLVNHLSGSHHFADERSLEEHGSVSEGRLFVGHHGYSTVVLAEGCRLNAVGQRLVEEFKAAGGCLLAGGEVPPDVGITPSPFRGEGWGEGEKAVCKIHWDAVTPPPNSFLLEPLRETTDWWRASFTVGSVLNTPLSLQFADNILHAELDGLPLALGPTGEGSRSELPSTAGAPGPHVLRFQPVGQDCGPLFVWLHGDFRVLSQSEWTSGPGGTIRTAGPWMLAPGASVAAGADLVAAGWPFAKGASILRGTFTVAQNLPAGSRLSLTRHSRNQNPNRNPNRNRNPISSALGKQARGDYDYDYDYDYEISPFHNSVDSSRKALLDIASDAARLVLDGDDLGWVWGPDWSVVLPKALTAGIHRIELHLVPSTYNHFGPHHHIDGDRHVVSPDQFIGKKNFADRPDAPACTFGAYWHFRRVVGPSCIALNPDTLNPIP